MILMELILVDSNDREIGYETKEKCHYGVPPLHRAFSVLVFNRKGQMLIQKRSSKKKTWPGYWANACCSSPKKGEEIKDSVKKRMLEELGFSCEPKFLFKFEYSAMYDSLWGENEIDHVFECVYDGDIKENKEEVDEVRFVSLEDLKEDATKKPEKYAPWFLIILHKLYGVKIKPEIEWRFIS